MLRKVIIGALAAANLGMLVAVWQSRPTMPSNQTVAAAIKRDHSLTNNVKTQTKHLTYGAVSKQIDRQAVDLTAAQKKCSDRINKVFTRVYNDSHSQDDYNNLRKNLKNDAGVPLANALLKADTPQLNEKGQRTLRYTKLNGLKIAYGSYNVGTHELPVSVSVDYQDQLDKGGHALWSMTYNVQTDQITQASVQPMNK